VVPALKSPHQDPLSTRSESDLARWPSALKITPSELGSAVPLPVGAVAYASGSFFEGFGNATSDLDVYVIADSLPDTAHRLGSRYTRAIDIIRLASVRVDAEYWLRQDVEQAAANLRAADPDDPEGLEFPGADEVIDFVHRLKIGFPLTGTPAFRRLQSLFDFDRARRILTAMRVLQYQEALVDADGAMRSARYETAASRARVAVFYALDAYLVGLGETYANEKWIYEKLIRQHGRGSALYQAVWAVDHGGIEANTTLYVRRCLALAADLVLCAQAGGRYGSS
jgi:hypothetical protein